MTEDTKASQSQGQHTRTGAKEQDSQEGPPKRKHPKLRVLAICLMVLLAVIAVVLLWIRVKLPGWLEAGANKGLAMLPNAEATCGSIEVDLRKGEIRVGQLGISLVEQGQRSPILGWKKLIVSFEPTSALGSVVKVRHLTFDSLVCNLEQDAGGGLNVVKLIPKPQGECGTDAPQEPPQRGAVLGGIKLTNSRLSYTDHTVGAGGVRTILNQIELDARAHYNLFQQGGTFCAFALRARLATKAPGGINLVGTVSADDALRVDARFEIDGLDLAHIDPYCGDSAIKLDGGTADVTGSFVLMDNQLNSRFAIMLHDVKVSSRKGIVRQAVFGMPTQAALMLLGGRSGELPVVVEIKGNVGDPDFHVQKTIIRSVAGAFTKRARGLGGLGAAVVDAGVSAGKAAATMPVEAAKKIVDEASKVAAPPTKAIEGALKGASSTLRKGFKKLIPGVKDAPKEGKR